MYLRIFFALLTTSLLNGMESAFTWEQTLYSSRQQNDANELPIKQAIKTFDLEQMKKLCSQNKNLINETFLAELPNSRGWHVETTPLMYIFGQSAWDKDAREKQINVISYLINSGANVNVITDAEKYTPLHHAVLWQRPDLVKLLLEKSASIEAENAHGDTPLTTGHRELNEETMAIAQHLIQYGASIIAQTDKNSMFYSHLIFIDEFYKFHPQEALELVFEALKYAIEKHDAKRFKELFSHSSKAIKKGIERYAGSLLSLIENAASFFCNEIKPLLISDYPHVAKQ